ncbi:hypothetical protein [Actinosynnema sp. NPDC020468]|uniref:hypothetical protein n=1 Tax=Actinosynnema sp. NPDC020468 TaxID=3154488 RepID=UPI0033D00AE5
MNGPYFEVVDDVVHLYRLITGPGVLPAGYFVGFRATKALASRGDGTYDMYETWKDDGGVYVFATPAPVSYPAFVAGVDHYRAKFPELRFLWANGVDRPAAQWRTSSVDVVGRVVRKSAVQALDRYAVGLFGEVTLTTQGFVFGAGQWAAADGTPYGITKTQIPYTGHRIGCVTGSVTLNRREPDDFTRLDVGLRYSLGRDGGGHDVVHMPLLTRLEPDVLLHLAFDPLSPFERGELAFSGEDEQVALPKLRSTFSLAMGVPVRLRPYRGEAPLWPARLRFAVSPRTGGADEVYLTPDGAFLVEQLPADGSRMLLGQTGSEYVDLGLGAIALFQAGHPAFVPAGGGTALEARGTTARVAIVPRGTTPLDYYAEPPGSPLFTRTADPRFLTPHPIVAARLARYTKGIPPVVPMGAYLGLAAALVPHAAAIERRALAPVRRALLATPAHAVEAGGPLTPAVTPGGLLVRLAGDAWDQVVLAALPDSPVTELVLTAVTGRARTVLQSPEAFAVVSNVAEFLARCSVRYRVDAAVRALLLAAKVPADVVAGIAAAAGTTAYPTEKAFTAAVSAAAGTHLRTLLSVAGQLKPTVRGWTFQLSPRSWRTGPDTGTVLLVKFATRTLAELIADPGCWGWPEAALDAHHDAAPTRKLLAGVVEDARERAKAESDGPYARFLDDVVDNPAWNGFLFLNAPVAITELAHELGFVAAGVVPGKLYAHHVGFSLGAFRSTADGITPGRGSVFGLIAYDDPADLTVAPGGADFAFKTQRLTARFDNSGPAGFTARVELMVNALYGTRLTRNRPERGNNLVLTGTYQVQNDRPGYAFTLADRAEFGTADPVLTSVDIAAVQVRRATSGAGNDVAFALSGTLRFAELPDVDLFSYGPTGSTDGWLRFTNLVVTLGTVAGKHVFTTDYDRVVFDPADSRPRPRSLVANLPIRVVGSVAVSDPGGATPEDLGYTAVATDVATTVLSAPWFGLVHALDLGTVGDLGDGAPLGATLLTAWSPADPGGPAPVFLGLTTAGDDPSWTVQGVLRLGYGGAELITREDGADRAYLVRLRRLVLSVLGVSIPPGGVDALVFGDPSGDTDAIGWYAAYAPPRADPPRGNR